MFNRTRQYVKLCVECWRQTDRQSSVDIYGPEVPGALFYGQVKPDMIRSGKTAEAKGEEKIERCIGMDTQS
jgi:hypothetical protein